MKFTILLFSTASACRTWKWKTYCDFTQYVVADSLNDAGSQFDTTCPCFQWCKEQDSLASKQYKDGVGMCCGYEKWSDGSYNCYLYAGNKTEPQDTATFKEDTFASYTFPHLYFEKEVEWATGAYQLSGAAVFSSLVLFLYL